MSTKDDPAPQSVLLEWSIHWVDERTRLWFGMDATYVREQREECESELRRRGISVPTSPRDYPTIPREDHDG